MRLSPQERKGFLWTLFVKRDMIKRESFVKEELIMDVNFILANYDAMFGIYPLNEIEA